MTTHDVEHNRVHAAIANHILAFAKDYIGTRFHMRELNAYVGRRVPTAPDSAGRILRALKQQGRLDYRVVSRAASEYEIVSVEGVPQQLALIASFSGVLTATHPCGATPVTVERSRSAV